MSITPKPGFVFGAFGLVLGSCALPITAAAGPCDDPAHRAFDFWLGEWQVRTPDGKLAGTHRIESEYGGCVLHERHATARGYRGESLNMHGAGRRVWHQTWVDTAGTLLRLEGGLRDGSMVLEGHTVAADGKTTRHRFNWTPRADGSVRQLWESTDASGQVGGGFRRELHAKVSASERPDRSRRALARHDLPQRARWIANGDATFPPNT